MNKWLVVVTFHIANVFTDRSTGTREILVKSTTHGIDEIEAMVTKYWEKNYHAKIQDVQCFALKDLLCLDLEKKDTIKEIPGQEW